MTHETSQPSALLLTEISRDLRPVRPRPVPSRMTLLLMPVAIAASLSAVTLIGVRGDSTALGPLVMWGASIIQVAVGLVLVWIAARETIPAQRLPRSLVWSISVTAWLVVAAVALWTYSVGPTLVLSDLAASRAALVCGVGGGLVGASVVVAFAWFFRHSLAARPALTGAIYGAGAGITVNGGWRLACPVSTPWHFLTAHGPAMVSTVVLGAVVAHLMASSRRSHRIPPANG
jgi:hypothetical protein